MSTRSTGDLSTAPRTEAQIKETLDHFGRVVAGSQTTNSRAEGAE